MKPIIIDVEWREVKTESMGASSSLPKPMDKFTLMNIVIIELVIMFYACRFTIGLIDNYQYWSANGGVTFERLVFGI